MDAEWFHPYEAMPHQAFLVKTILEIQSAVIHTYIERGEIE